MYVLERSKKPGVASHKGALVDKRTSKRKGSVATKAHNSDNSDYSDYSDYSNNSDNGDYSDYSNREQRFWSHQAMNTHTHRRLGGATRPSPWNAW